MFEVSGDWRKLVARITSLQSNLGRVVSIIQEESERIKERQKSIAPVKTGYLKSHIVKRDTPSGAEIDSEAPYSRYVEYGTSRMYSRVFFRPPLIAGVARIKEKLIKLGRR